MGCAFNNNDTEDVESFSLTELMSGLHGEPNLYLVAPEEAPDKVVTYTREMIDGVGETVEEIYVLEDVAITEEEIIIQYEGQEERFERLSETVAENKNARQYHYEEQ